MAEMALVSVAGAIINNLVTPLAKEQICLLWGFKKELRKLESTVSTIQAVLQDAEERQSKSHAISNWLGKLTDVLYEADDLLDSVSIEALRGKVMTSGKKAKVRVFFSKPKKLLYDLIMANKIKDIREKLDFIAAERRDLHLEERHVETRVWNRDTCCMLGMQEVIIGRDDDKKIIIERLEANVERNVSILAIVGIGGLGKTSLAKLIFNDERFTKNFDLKSWVCVSDIFDGKDIVKKIIGYVTRSRTSTDVWSELVRQLRAIVDKKKYLIVLDDVWNEDHMKWLELEYQLMDGLSGSRILVTTRSSKVAEVMDAEPYKLKGLNEESSWNLFKELAFRGQQEPINSIKLEIGMEVVRKCAGVPLAVKTVGSLLRSKTSEFWSDFREKDLSSLSQNFEIDILPTLKLSYDKLPSRLKQCFAYCSLFSKDYGFCDFELIYLWIAQGFVESRVNQSLEDVACEYFMNLLSLSFFQLSEDESNYFDKDNIGDIIYCKMHDLMHDLAISVAGSSISIVDDVNRNINEKTRFLAINGDNKVLLINQFSFKADMIRTYYFHPKTDLEDHVIKIDCEAIFSSFSNLRALTLNFTNLEFLPSSISKLKHLRYLNLSGNFSLQQLLESISTLQTLQTLTLLNCMSLENLPRGITNLINLRCLDFGGCYKVPKLQGLGQLTNLQYLRPCEFPKYYVGLDELNKLNNLRGSLQILDLRNDRDIAIQYEAMNLKQKSYLCRLYLSWIDIREVDSSLNDMSFGSLKPHPNLKSLGLGNYPDFRFPSWILSLTSLVDLRISSCKRCKYLSPLNQLPKLKNLTVYRLEGLEYILDINYTDKDIIRCTDTNNFSVASSSLSVPLVFFPMLEYLEIFGCQNLKGWWESDSFVEDENEDHGSLPSFQRLLKLTVISCYRFLTPLPSCPNLEYIFLRDMVIPSLFPLTTPLPKLKRLHFSLFSGLGILPESWGQNLIALEELELENLDVLEHIRPIQLLTTLKRLTLYDCPKLEFANDENEMQWQGPTTLQTLHIQHCDRLTAIPNWIENCKLLEVLKIEKCYHFNTQRIKKETGEDWPKIAHISNLIVKDCNDCSVEEVETEKAAEEVEVAETVKVGAVE